MMPAYLVRHAERKTIAALIVAPSIAWLWDAVDEMGDPSEYEYRKVTRGGILCLGPQEFATTLSYPVGGEDDGVQNTDETGYFAPSEVSLSEHLEIEATCGRWVRLDCADEGDGMIARLSRAVDDAA